MAKLRFFTDEDIYRSTTLSLRKAGFDVISTPEAGQLGESDDSQLQWASHEGRVIVTFNVAHFVMLHTDWLIQGRHHAGVVVSSQRSIGDLARRLLHLADQLDADVMRDRLEFLSDW